jgi:hypothetical protein
MNIAWSMVLSRRMNFMTVDSIWNFRLQITSDSRVFSHVSRPPKILNTPRSAVNGAAAATTYILTVLIVPIFVVIVIVVVIITVAYIAYSQVDVVLSYPSSLENVS